MRGVFLYSAALSLALLGGCARLQRDRVDIGPLAGCPRESAATLAARQQEFGPTSPTNLLQCTLDFLRRTHDPAVRRTSLGSRICLQLAVRDADPARREQLAAEGVRFAEDALMLGANGVGVVHYYLAANLGLAVRDRLDVALTSLPRLEREMKRAVELSPEVDDGGPLRLLGMLYLKAPPWPSGIGDGDKALDLLKQAVDRHPGHPLNHLFYAQALWEVEGDSAAAQAKSEFATGLKLLDTGRWGYNQAPWAKEFGEVRKEIGASGLADSPAAASAS